jgi:hypothetical protein
VALGLEQIPALHAANLFVQLEDLRLDLAAWRSVLCAVVGVERLLDVPAPQIALDAAEFNRPLLRTVRDISVIIWPSSATTVMNRALSMSAASTSASPWRSALAVAAASTTDDLTSWDLNSAGS